MIEKPVDQQPQHIDKTGNEAMMEMNTLNSLPVTGKDDIGTQKSLDSTVAKQTAETGK